MNKLKEIEPVSTTLQKSLPESLVGEFVFEPFLIWKRDPLPNFGKTKNYITSVRDPAPT